MNNNSSNEAIPAWWNQVRELEIPLILLDKDSDIIDINNTLQESLGYTIKDLRHKTILDITSSKDHALEAKNIMDVFYGQAEITTIVKRFVTIGEEEIKVSQTTLKVADAESELVLLYYKSLQSSIDVTEDKLRKALQIFEILKTSEFGFNSTSPLFREFELLLKDVYKMHRTEVII